MIVSLNVVFEISLILGKGLILTVKFQHSGPDSIFSPGRTWRVIFVINVFDDIPSMVRVFTNHLSTNQPPEWCVKTRTTDPPNFQSQIGELEKHPP